MNEPAFPVSTSDPVEGHQDVNNTWRFPGMQLRDYFAAKALAGFLAHPAQDEAPLLDRNDAMLATESYRIADAMLKARHAAAKGGEA